MKKNQEMTKKRFTLNNRGSAIQTLFSMIFGLVLAWLLKNDLTRLLFQGKNFSGRNIPFKLGLIVFSAFFFFLLFCLMLSGLQRIHRVQSFFERVEKRIEDYFTKDGEYRALLILCLIVIGLGAAHLFSSIDPQTNDDVFVYYTYARNITEGRPFAYDVRNLPSEGFTSLLYLLLLTPFEFFKVNMTFASILINLAAVALTIYLAAKLAVKSQLLTRRSALLFSTFLSLCIVYDTNVRLSLEWGLETMLGPLVVLLAGTALIGSRNSLYHKNVVQSTSTQSDVNSFLAVLFIAYLVRPESMVVIAAAGVPLLLLDKPSRRQNIRKLLIFAVCFAAYHGVKYLIFGDIFPTGFYRKVSEGSGLAYVLGWLSAYKVWLIALAVVVTAALVLGRVNHDWSLFRSRELWFLGVVFIATLAFFTQINPLVGVGYRFLMTPIFLLFIFTGIFAFRLLDRILVKDDLKQKVYFGLLAVLLLACGTQVYLSIDQSNPLAALDIHARSVKATEEHKYLQFGNYLHNAIQNREEITLVFGDAGAIPYSFGGRFIDSNGLTEPAIAHLFSLPDGAQKDTEYIQYILAQHPDIVVLAWGKDVQATGTWLTPVNVHSPFKKAIPLEIYQAYKDYGIVYACSINLYSDLHIGLWSKSPNYGELQKVFDAYCAGNGYTLPGGLTITDGSNEVVFPVGE